MRSGSCAVPPFVHLHVHSYYSFFASTLSPAEIVAWAAGLCLERSLAPSWKEPRGDMLPQPKAWPGKETGEKGHEASPLITSFPPAIALTDTNSMTGAVEFYQAALAQGVKPILGLELTEPWPHERELWRERLQRDVVPSEEEARQEDDSLGEKGGSRSPALCQGDLSRRVVLLARNLAGYHELCELATQRMLDPAFELLSIVPFLSPNVVLASDWPEALTAAQERGAPWATYGLLIPGRAQRLRNRAIYERCRQLNLPLLVGCDVRMAGAQDADLLLLLEAMRDLSTVERLRHAGRSGGGGSLWSADEVAQMFALGRGHALEPDLRQAMLNTVRVAEMCDCRLPLREWKFPKLSRDSTEGHERLRALALQGLRWRYGDLPPAAARERLEYELGIISQLGFCDYFLLVHRIVQEARRRGFFTLGRGSAANSIVTYVLGISHVCPLRHGLHFERFLNPERSSPPDIDLDFSWRERDEILRWCFEFFGHEKVALISTIQTLRMRQAVREVGKAWGLSPEELNGFNRLKSVGYVVEERGEGATTKLRELGLEEPWRTILHYAQRLAGWPRHLSIHCGGVVIAPENVNRWVPLTRSAKGFVITQMDMVGVEELGLVKMDLLSNRSLGVLKDALQAAEQTLALGQRTSRAGAPPPSLSLPSQQRASEVPDPAHHNGKRAKAGHEHDAPSCQAAHRGAVLAHEAARMKLAGTRRGTSVALAGLLEHFDQSSSPSVHGSSPRSLRELIFDLETLTQDPATRALIHEGRTMGCFYIESPGMRALFERLRCREFAEVVAASSIIRPGVAESGMMDEYIARHQGRQRPRQRFERVQALLQRLLPETYGVMVYQEDVLLVAHEIAGMSYGEADVLRRAMSGKSRGEEAMAAAHERFVSGAMERHGLTREEAEEIWRQIASFAGYSFCKGHSAAFAVLSYQVAWLKAHYPAEFFAAVLDNGGGFYGAGAYIEEARRWGVRIMNPCVNCGEVSYRGRTHHAAHLQAQGWVQVGLGAIAQISDEVSHRIVNERRAHGPYRSLHDFLSRTAPAPHEARQLARAGALDCLAAPSTMLSCSCGEQGISLHAMSELCASRQRILLELELAFRETAWGDDAEDLPLSTKETAPLPDLASPANEGKRQRARGDRLASIAPREGQARLCRWEMETLGFMVHGHPLDFVEIPPAAVPARRIRRFAGRRVTMVGWAIAAKELTASNSGQPMKMLTLEDRTDSFEAVLFPKVYARYAPRTLSCGPYLVQGRVDMRLGSPTLEVENIEVLPMQLC